MIPLVLIIDDKVEITKVIAMFLRGTFRTEQVFNGREALVRLRSKELEMPAIIVTDVNMPEMDGYKFVENVKSDSALSHIPVLVLSSVESSADRIRMLEMGAADFMLKPFNPEELRVRIKRLL